jgi:hypothetical protein
MTKAIPALVVESSGGNKLLSLRSLDDFPLHYPLVEAGIKPQQVVWVVPDARYRELVNAERTAVNGD